MLALKKFFRFNSAKNSEASLCTKSFIFVIITNFLEDVLFWKNKWLSLLFVFYFHLFFFVCFYRQFNMLQVLCGFLLIVITLDAFESWLKYKHRTSCLKRLASRNDTNKLPSLISQTHMKIKSDVVNLIQLRDQNPTKAFLLLEIVFSIIFITGKYISGYTLVYILFITVMSLNKVLPPIQVFGKKLQQTADSEFELEGLVPEITPANLNLLSIETETQQIIDEKHSLDCWKPDDLAIDDASDSSENSSSLVTNLSVEKLHTLEKEVDSTDSSDDEYIPDGQQQEPLTSTMEVEQVGSWGSSAYRVISSMSGAVANMVYSANEEKKRKRVSSVDSSDGFEMVDKNDIM